MYTTKELFSASKNIETPIYVIKERTKYNKQIFDEVKADIENYSVEPVIFHDAQRSGISTRRD